MFLLVVFPLKLYGCGRLYLRMAFTTSSPIGKTLDFWDAVTEAQLRSQEQLYGCISLCRCTLIIVQSAPSDESKARSTRSHCQSCDVHSITRRKVSTQSGLDTVDIIAACHACAAACGQLLTPSTKCSGAVLALGLPCLAESRAQLSRAHLQCQPRAAQHSMRGKRTFLIAVTPREL